MLGPHTDLSHNAQGCLTSRGEVGDEPRERAWDRLQGRKLNTFLAYLNSKKEQLAMTLQEVRGRAV